MLVVDDDEGVRTLLHRWLDDAGHEVHARSDALGALECSRTVPVDVVICDIRMPGPNGVWLIEQIAAEQPLVPIIVATGLREMDPAVTLRPSVARYLTKPFDRATFLAAVDDALAARQS